MRSSLALAVVALTLAPTLARAQVGGRVEPCPPGWPCARAAVTVVAPAPPAVVVEAAPARRSGVVVVESATPADAPAIEAPPPAGPVDPAPGSVQLAYTGSFDGVDVTHGGVARFTGQLGIPLLGIEVGFGARTRGDGPGATFTEVPLTLGLRILAPLLTPIVRVYGVFATGVSFLVRGRDGDEARTVGAWPAQLGAGLELGGPVSERMSIGGFVDVRAESRVPFEQLEPSLSVAWSAGFAMLWF